VGGILVVVSPAYKPLSSRGHLRVPELLTVYEHHSGLHQLVEDKAALPKTALRVVSMATLKIAIWVERGAYLKPSSYFYVCSGVSIGLASNPQALFHIPDPAGSTPDVRRVRPF